MNFRGAGNRRGPSSLEIAIMIGNLNPNSTTRPCTQCSREVPKNQVLLTCDKCRESKKRQKARRKERDLAIEEGSGKGPNGRFSSAPLQAVIARQDQETATKRAARRKDPTKATTPISNPNSMGMILQAILNEHEAGSSSAPKKKATKKTTRDEESLEDVTNRCIAEMTAAKGKSGAGTKRKLKEVDPNEPGSVYDAETARKRMRGDMPKPVPNAGASLAAASKELDKEDIKGQTRNPRNQFLRKAAEAGEPLRVD
ncbi:hypothetical protein DFH07DRAFT_950281 [Mycena maculata]|uniref:Uncharacterized protein n=1 Tax=Mycena maculata TaxID=230809 RepID=A0AAD7K816_9AGAR|nr:hypothetical protein DFH07DRAFT_950281 [Mycena maculata]